MGGPGSPRDSRRLRVIEHAGHAADPAAVRDAHAVGDRRAAADQHAVAQHDAAGQRHVRGERAVLAHLHVVAHVDLVVQLAAAPDARDVEARAVQRAVGADLHVVADLHRAHLRDLDVPAVLVLPVAEAVLADDRAGVHHDAVTQPAARAHHDARVQPAVAADLRALADDHAGPQLRAGADARAGADHHVRADGRLGPRSAPGSITAVACTPGAGPRSRGAQAVTSGPARPRRPRRG